MNIIGIFQVMEPTHMIEYCYEEARKPYNLYILICKCFDNTYVIFVYNYHTHSSIMHICMQKCVILYNPVYPQ